MRLELTTLHRQLRATMIYVTHDQVEAMTMADRIVVLEAGAIQQVGTPMDLYRNPRNLFVAGFIGSPRMNLLPATITAITPTSLSLVLDDGTPITLANFATTTLSPGDTVTLGIRPEHLPLDANGPLAGGTQTVEHLGSESYLHLLTMTGRPLTVRVNGETSVRPGDPVNLQLNPNLLHLFDAIGNAIPRQPAPALNA